MENKEIKQEVNQENNLTNNQVMEAINNLSQEIKQLKQEKKNKMEVEKIDTNVIKTNEKDSNVITLKEFNLEPFNQLNDFIFKHTKE